MMAKAEDHRSEEHPRADIHGPRAGFAIGPEAGIGAFCRDNGAALESARFS